MQISMQLLGANDIKKNLKTANGRFRRAVGAGLYIEGNNIMAESKRVVPVDFGILKNSGYVTLPTETRDRITVELGYGGPAKEYAAIVHEKTEWNFQVGGAKYLQNPVNHRTGTMSSNVAAFAKQNFERNQGAEKTTMPTNPEGE